MSYCSQSLQIWPQQGHYLDFFERFIILFNLMDGKNLQVGNSRYSHFSLVWCIPKLALHNKRRKLCSHINIMPPGKF
jgi:hypothetical protein